MWQHAQLVQRWSESQDTILTQFEFPLPLNFHCRLSYDVSAAPLWATADIDICARAADPNQQQPHCCMATCRLHTLIAMGSTARKLHQLYQSIHFQQGIDEVPLLKKKEKRNEYNLILLLLNIPEVTSILYRHQQ